MCERVITPTSWPPSTTGQPRDVVLATSACAASWMVVVGPDGAHLVRHQVAAPWRRRPSGSARRTASKCCSKKTSAVEERHEVREVDVALDLLQDRGRRSETIPSSLPSASTTGTPGEPLRRRTGRRDRAATISGGTVTGFGQHHVADRGVDHRLLRRPASARRSTRSLAMIARVPQGRRSTRSAATSAAGGHRRCRRRCAAAAAAAANGSAPRASSARDRAGRGRRPCPPWRARVVAVAHREPAVRARRRWCRRPSARRRRRLRSASARALRSRRAATPPVARRAAAPASPACGVMIVGARAAGERVEVVAEGVEAVGVEHERRVDRGTMRRTSAGRARVAPAARGRAAHRRRPRAARSRGRRPRRELQRASGRRRRSVIGSVSVTSRIGLQRGRHARRHEPGAGAQGRAGARARTAPVMPREPPTTTHAAGVVLRAAARPRRGAPRSRPAPASSAGAGASAAVRDADGDDHDLAGVGEARARSRRPSFSAWNVTVTSARDGGRGDLAGRRVDAARHVEREHRPTGAADGLDRGGHRAARRARCSPVPSSASTTSVGAAQARRPTAPTRETGTPAARRRLRPGRVAGVGPRRDDEARGLDAERDEDARRPARRRRCGRRRRRRRRAGRPGSGSRSHARGGRRRRAAISSRPGRRGLDRRRSVARIDAASCRSLPDQNCVPSQVPSFCRSPGTFDVVERLGGRRAVGHHRRDGVDEHVGRRRVASRPSSAATARRGPPARRPAPGRPGSGGARGRRPRTRRCGRVERRQRGRGRRRLRGGARAAAAASSEHERRRRR